jgi:hypothetical protein
MAIATKAMITNGATTDIIYCHVVWSVEIRSYFQNSLIGTLTTRALRGTRSLAVYGYRMDQSST